MILNWCNSDITIGCIRSVIADAITLIGRIDVQIVVVDNASTDDSAIHIKRFIAQTEQHEVHFIESTRNGGYAAGNNIGIRFALQQSPPNLVWLLNNDTVVRSGAITAMVNSAISQPNVAIWGASIVDPDTDELQCAGGCYYHVPSSAYRANFAGKKLAQREQLNLNQKLLSYISGASMCIRADILSQIGLLNEQYFLYFEELDFVRRLPKGYSLGWCKEAVVEHVGGATIESQNGVTNANTTADYYSTLSALQFTRRYHRFWLITVLPVRFMAKGAIYLLNGNLQGFLTMCRSYRDFFTTTS